MKQFLFTLCMVIGLIFLSLAASDFEAMASDGKIGPYTVLEWQESSLKAMAIPVENPPFRRVSGAEPDVKLKTIPKSQKTPVHPKSCAFTDTL